MAFCMSAKDGAVQIFNMDLRESMWHSTKVFSRRSACTTCCETFLAQNFHGIQ